MLYEVMSGYLRGFGISLVPAILTTVGVCGIRIAWVYTIFPKDRTFKTLLMAYPLSRHGMPGNKLIMKGIVFTMIFSAVLILIALLAYHPAARAQKNQM